VAVSLGENSNAIGSTSTAPNNAIYIDASGNVGIGTTSPSQLFTVGNNNQFTVDASGNINSAGTLTVAGLITGDNGLTITSGAVSFPGGSIDGSALTNNSITGAKIQLGGEAIGDMMYYNGTDWVGLAASSTGSILQANGASAPTWVATSSLGFIAGGNNSTTTFSTTTIINLTNTTINNSTSTNMYMSTSTIDNSVINNSTTTNSYISTSTIDNSTINNSNFTGGSITNTTISGSSAWNGSTIDVPYGGTGATTLAGVLKGNNALAVSGMTGATNYIVKWTPDNSTIGNSMIYDNGSNVGIGTTSPNSLLHLYKNDNLFNAELALQSGDGTTVQDKWSIYNNGINGGDGSLRFWNNNISGDKNALTILNSGSIGIGTSTPQQKLHLSGGAFQIDSFIPGTTANALYNNSGALMWDGNPVAVSLGENSNAIGSTSTAPNNAIYIDASGNVGIGTTSPSQLFTVGNNNQFTVDASGNINSAGTLTVAGLITGDNGLTITSGAVSFPGGSIDGSALTNNSITGAKIQLGGEAIGDMMYYNGTDWVGLAASSTGSILQANGASAPTWVATSSLGFIAGGNNSTTTFSTTTIINLTDTTINNSTSTNMYMSTSTIDNSVINNSTTTNSYISTSTIDNSTINNSNFTGGSITNTTISGSSAWNGSTIDVPYGGTGATTFDQNYLIRGNGANPLLSSSAIYDDGTNIGIGTTTPTFKLDVNGIINATALYVNGAPYIGSQWGTAGSNIYFNSGNVGIGTSTPQQKLSLSGGAFQIDSFIPGATTNALYNDNGTLMWNGNPLLASSNVNINVIGSTSTAPNNAIYVDSNGLVGINTTTPDSMLTIIGTSTNALLNIITASSSPAFYIDANGNIGIGTSSPSATLTVAGGVFFDGDLDMNNHNITGVNKLTVTTIDPLYDINGTKYSTYAPSIAGGVKEETTGVLELRIKNNELGNNNSGNACSVETTQDYSYTIDFNNLEQGSNLWLFHKIVDFGKDWENLVIVLTPNFNGNVWYEKDIANNKLIIHGKPDGSASEVSYRLIANRYDSEKWPNLAPDQNEKTSLIIK
jgi:hypothetical protein